MDNQNGKPQGLTIDQIDFNNRLEAFQKEFNELQKKHRVYIAAALDASMWGIIPQITFVDEKVIENMQKNMQQQQSTLTKEPLQK